MSWIIINLLFVIVVFIVVGCILVTIISRAARGSQSFGPRNTYLPGDYRAGSSASVGTTPLEIVNCIDSDPALVGAAVDLGYMQAGAGNMSQPQFDSGAMDQQATDSGAFGSSGADVSTASSAGWDAGSAAGASIGSDMASSTVTGSMDSGMSGGGMDSGSSGM